MPNDSATAFQYAPAGRSYNDNVYRDEERLLLRNTADTAIALRAAQAVGSESSGENADKNVMALGGTMRMGAGDAIYLTFAKSGTVSGPVFLVTYWVPILGSTGKIVGYSERPLCEIDSTLTYGSVAIGTPYASVAAADGTAPATAPAGTETWASAITANVNGTAVSTSSILNNMDIIETDDDGPATLRITPLDGATHISVQMKTGGGGGTMLCFARRGRGGALNRS